VEDDLLAAAVRFIKHHCHERIQVGNILEEVPISRRALEKGFRKWLGRSPAEEIRRIRVDRAVQLLCDTSWSMPRIATAVGFDRPELLTRAFRRELSTTPSEFRRRHLCVERAAATFEGNPRASDLPN
jgi:LacI family transcriptional regulator